MLRPNYAFICATILVISGTLRVLAQPAESGTPAPNPLQWDEIHKRFEPSGDAASHLFIFVVKNTGATPVTIEEVKPSCGCTVADFPVQPWTLAPGGQGTLKVTMDISGKTGTVTKSLAVTTTAGSQTLFVEMTIPRSAAELATEASRQGNQLLARADRQAVFRGECAKCHLAPTTGRKGWILFQAACAICHQAEHRASMVPDLTVTSQRRDEAYWRRWITQGAEKTLMPAFAQEHGGPLNEEQVESLVRFLVRRYSATVAPPVPQPESNP